MDGPSLLLIAAGLVALVAGAELLVRGASRIAARLGISSLVIGLTVVALGTSSPELAVSLIAALRGDGSIAVGNVVGSNIANILFILGISALIVPLAVARQILRRDLPIMLGVSLLLGLIAIDGRITAWEGVLLLAGITSYTAFAVRLARRERASNRSATNSSAPPARSHGLAVNALLVAAGLAILVLGSRWLVQGAVTLARELGVSELVIGLTIVAIGTSLPEVATSILAAIRGERDIAVGNVVGSNIFNILAVLGAAGLAAPGGLSVPAAAIRADIPFMIVVAAICIPIFITGRKISRAEGALLLLAYAGYTGYLIHGASTHGPLVAVP